MPESQIYQLYPTPLYQGQMNIDDKDKDFIIKQEYMRMPTDNGSFSVNHHLLDLNELSQMRKDIITHMNVFTRNYLTVPDKFNFYMQNSWAVKHERKDWAQGHVHSNSLLSGVLYLQTDETSGDICFHKPTGLTNIFPECVNLPFEQQTPHNSEEWCIRPRPGDILIFPAHLYHSVRPNNSNMDRYVIAFNFHVEGELYSKGSKINYLKLYNGNEKKI